MFAPYAAPLARVRTSATLRDGVLVTQGIATALGRNGLAAGFSQRSHPTGSFVPRDI